MGLAPAGRAGASHVSSRVTIMRLPRFRVRVRTLMLAVAVVALLVWGAMMGTQSYDYYRRAREYGANERGWREIAARKRGSSMARFASECAEYFAPLARKYRRAMWRPWMPVAPDPPAPGVLEAQGQ
jgi:hypothetical protein